MKVITTKVPDKMTKKMEEFMRRRGYPSQSEFVRDAIRRMLEPELDEKIIREIIVAREQVRRGETIPLEKLERSLEE
jgi:Arc/MetJ-type ribon-helix-helix transcriptional regulator